MLRIFVTGDNHIGLKCASYEKSTELSENRIDVFKSMVECANKESCDLFVITGDLFDSTRSAAKKTIAKLLDILASFEGIVAVLPGNHDYYSGDVKVWQYFESELSIHDNIMLLKDYKPYKRIVNGEEVVLYPALCMSKHSEQNNLGWIKNEEILNDGAYHIGIAHGAVEGETIDNEARYFLMKRDELEKIPVDVWLIGHTHVPFPRNLTEEFTPAEKIFNAGTHVQTDVACNSEGQCFIVEIGDDKSVRAKKFISGNVRFYRKNINIFAGEMENILKRELTEYSDGSIVEITLTGLATFEEYDNRRAIIERALSRFIESKYNDNSLSKLITRELIEAEFPETSFSAGLLSALLDEPKEAQLAYELLKSLREAK